MKGGFLRDSISPSRERERESMVSRRARVELAPGSSLLGKETGVPGNPRTVYAFLGVPYAAPPIGKNRFLPPRPYGRLWQGEREATEFGE